MTTEQVIQELRNLRERSRIAKAERDKRTQPIERLEDLDLLVEGEDLVRLENWGQVVYYRKDEEKITLLGKTCRGEVSAEHDGYGGAFIDIPLKELRIDKWNTILHASYQIRYFELDQEHRQLLERTGVLY